MLKNQSLKHIALTAICAAILTACGGGGGNSPDTNSTNIAKEVNTINKVDKEINDLPEADAITPDGVQTVLDAQQSYNQLSPEQRSYIKPENRSKLESLLATINESKKAAASLAQQVRKLPQSSDDIDTAAEEKALAAANAVLKSLNDNQKKWIDEATLAHLNKLNNEAIADSNPLPALNLPTPLHTSFIATTTAQQHNPHMQLRTVDGKPALRDDQIGLIRDLETSPNAPVVVDGVILNNTTTNGNATEVRFTTPASSITKAFSGGISQEDVSKQFGTDPNSVFEPGKTTVDSIIEKNFADIQAAEDAIVAAKEALAEESSEKNQKALEKAEENKAKAEKAYVSNRLLRKNLENASVTAIDNLAYFKKDKNGLVFGKPFDGVYVLQFADGTRITLHDSAAAGWHYQTFAHYIDPKNGITHGYQSIGDETVGTAMPTSGTATYKGISTAYLTENGKNDRQLTADVTAIADFSKKGIRFTTSNSHFHKLDSKGIRISEKADGYNMKGTASWAADSNTFKGTVRTQDRAMSGTLNGKFYGAAAAEIGGTYGLKNSSNSLQLIGGYGAKRK